MHSTVQVVSQARLPEPASPTVGSSLRDRLPHASGKMSASRVAALFEPMRGIALKSAILGTPLLARCDLLAKCVPTARNGSAARDVRLRHRSTYCSQQGKLTENTIIRGEKQSAARRARTSRRSTRTVVPLFRDGLADYPSGIRLPFSVSYYTEPTARRRRCAPQADRTGRSTIRQLPLPQKRAWWSWETPAFDAEAIQTACEERSLVGSCPSTRRVLAGEKPRPKVSSLSEDLTADQMVCLRFICKGST